mgnify:CR=1 FL=1
MTGVLDRIVGVTAGFQSFEADLHPHLADSLTRMTQMTMQPLTPPAAMRWPPLSVLPPPSR